MPHVTIGLNVVNNPNWPGARVYMNNLIYCLDSLPDEQKPRVKLVGMLGADPALASELLSFDFVSTTFAPGATGVKRFLLRAYRKVLNQLGFDPELRGVDVMFPSFSKGHFKGKQIYWIPDFQDDHLPHFFSKNEIEGRRKKNLLLSQQDGVVVTNSYDSLNDYKRLFPNSRAVPMRWAYCSVLTEHEEGGQDPHHTYGVAEKYLYMPNQFWAHKDHLTVFKALLLLKKKGVFPQLVLTGKEIETRDPDHVAMLHAFVRENGLEDQIKFLGFIPRNDQIEIFRHCAAVVQPSRFESWSIVVEDTRALGRPIILSDIAVNIEQNPPHATYFKTGDAENLASVIEKLWPDLKPGPDLETQKKAKTHTDALRLTTARSFMEIVAHALRLSAPS